MNFKVVKDISGNVIAFGLNCVEYEPTVAEGNTLEIRDELPIIPTENPRIAAIKAELDALDFKRIRPIAEGDTVYLAELNKQVLTLRSELKVLTTPAEISVEIPEQEIPAQEVTQGITQEITVEPAPLQNVGSLAKED